MPEFDNDSDRLEQFFRKATNKPEVTFSEDDWRKLEARLDAADAARAANVKSPKKTIITAAVIGALLLSSVGIWWGSETEEKTSDPEQASVSSPVTAKTPAESIQDQNTARETPDESGSLNGSVDGSLMQPDHSIRAEQITSSSEEAPRQEDSRADRTAVLHASADDAPRAIGDRHVVDEKSNHLDRSVLQKDELAVALNEQTQSVVLAPLTDDQIREELIVSSSDLTQRNKQRARIELPGAEEADQTGRQTMVEEEHASDKKEHVAKPRLSLLLTFAPDFSGTSLGRYSAPGKAFGGMIYYHLKNRWSVSAGVVKNYKQYTGSGEDYTPPTGYWKYYTNGVIPETIDGSCSILEFPVMVHYTVRDVGRNRWVVGAGASSYLMQSESYHYHFAQPNPGAKEGWDSRGSSRFMFNMLNLTVGYEHQVIPGLMIGLEPYVKVPLEEIGWSNLRLYSSGASITLRYTLIGRKEFIQSEVRSRGPD